jgi:hypothetical protein
MHDFGLALAVVLLTLCCNLCLLVAIAAGRAEPSSSSRALRLVGEIVLFAGSFAAAGWVVLTLGNPYTSGIGFVATWSLGFVIAVVLVFLEYAFTGHKKRFVADLRGSLWPTRIGFRRL